MSIQDSKRLQISLLKGCFMKITRNIHPLTGAPLWTLEDATTKQDLEELWKSFLSAYSLDNYELSVFCDDSEQASMVFCDTSLIQEASYELFDKLNVANLTFLSINPTSDSIMLGVAFNNTQYFPSGVWKKSSRTEEFEFVPLTRLIEASRNIGMENSNIDTLVDFILDQ